MSKKIKKKVPELRFSEFDEPLSLKYLGEILDFKNGINADKSQYGSGKKFINVLDIINNAPIYHDSIIGSVDITEKEFEKNNVVYGDILFQRSSEIREEAGQSNIYLDSNHNTTFGGFVIRGRPKVSFNPIYFNYLLKTRFIRKEITDRSGGSTRFNVGQNLLSQVPALMCNSIEEQEKIASFLEACDRKLTQLRRKHELLQTYKRGVMQKIFSQEIRFKQDDGKPFPDWQKKKLGALLDFKNGINADKSQYGSGKKFINVLDIINDAPIYHDSIIGSVEITVKEFKNNNVKYGDILFQRSSEIRQESGQSNIYLDNNQEATFGGFVIRGRPKVDFNPIYFNHLLKTSSIRKEITNRSGGSTRFNVGQDSLRQVPLLTCDSIEEQEKIANFLTAIDKKIEAISLQIEKTELFKKGLLQKMFV
ncbi:MAG: restriction endonuclease subunit S [Cyanobacteria bacterium P01_A01_bin.83]